MTCLTTKQIKIRRHNISQDHIRCSRNHLECLIILKSKRFCSDKVLSALNFWWFGRNYENSVSVWLSKNFLSIRRGKREHMWSSVGVSWSTSSWTEALGSLGTKRNYHEAQPWRHVDDRRQPRRRMTTMRTTLDSDEDDDAMQKKLKIDDWFDRWKKLLASVARILSSDS